MACRWDDVPGPVLLIIVSELEQLLAADVETDTDEGSTERLWKVQRAAASTSADGKDDDAQLLRCRRHALRQMRQVCKGWCCRIDAGLHDLQISW